MIDNQPRYLHPIDMQKMLAGMVPTITDPATGSGGVTSSHYMATLCGKCHTPSPLTGRQIDFVHVCEYCYDLHQISSNRLPCPYKRPRSRKLPVKREPLKFEVTHAGTLNESIRT